MQTSINLGDITIEVSLKDIKNIHLSVHPPNGIVKISAPSHMRLQAIRSYAASRLGWIKKHQKKLQEQERETSRDYLTRESHYFFGKRYLLKVEETNLKQEVILKPREIQLIVKTGASYEQKQRVLEKWYRQQLKQKVGKYIRFWEERMSVNVSRYGIKKMRTKWGSCNQKDKAIWINLELVKKPEECIEYIIVHEMVHFFERKHDIKFISHMDHYLPSWRHNKELLNKLPLSHQEWNY